MEYLTSKDVAEKLKISVRSAQRLMKRLPHINIGVGTRRETLRISDGVLNDYQSYGQNTAHSSVKSIKKHVPKAYNSETIITKMPRR